MRLWSNKQHENSLRISKYKKHMKANSKENLSTFSKSNANTHQISTIDYKYNQIDI